MLGAKFQPRPLSLKEVERIPLTGGSAYAETVGATVVGDCVGEAEQSCCCSTVTELLFRERTDAGLPGSIKTSTFFCCWAKIQWPADIKTRPCVLPSPQFGSKHVVAGLRCSLASASRWGPPCPTLVLEGLRLRPRSGDSTSKSGPLLPDVSKKQRPERE